MVESVNDELKNICQIQHTRIRVFSIGSLIYQTV
ncbi:hypothetical protein IQA84_07405 [Leptospira borgpetersenii serovar Hardjo-bovis]|nr:hypothetical protein D1609_16955 [Leptospira borgpetersenii serovar Hardjo-bovis]TQE53676.1 hypothetical protein FFZ95_06725 [Leptospira borgpetersenii]MBE8360968.1 hypothetical protein [Leptospira borgpetersenii serovar Hardjo-bovis]MBE8376730.1 hypothetical protein [Leptospira borgpetersenii serovar Hardjo-bovis]MBF3319120.1 hypothetical protein [Leptospira borgpetersenii serovar Hardjo-bovis]